MKIHNARIPAGNAWQETDLIIADGRIQAIGHLEEVPAEETMDLSGKLLLPGAIDPHVHLDDPGFNWREDFDTGTLSAARGGVTTVIDMPETSLPNCRTVEGLLTKWNAVRSKAHVDYAFWGGVTGEEVRDGSYRDTMAALAGNGVVGFKIYTVSGMETYPAVNYGEMRAILHQAARLGLPVGLHAEDGDIIRQATSEVRQRAGTTWRDYLDSRPPSAECVAVAAAIELASESGAHLHIVHLSSGKSVELIASAKARGLRVSAETCPQYLLLESNDFNRWGSRMKSTPPVRERWDCEQLWQGLADGTLDFVATDHASCLYPEEKQGEDFFAAYAGMPGLETFFPLLWQEGYVAGRLPLERLLEVTSGNAARLYGLYPRKGSLAVGSDADFIVLDPRATSTISAPDLASKGKYTPFHGRVIKGRIDGTILRGNIVYLMGGKDAEAVGQWIKRR